MSVHAVLVAASHRRVETGSGSRRAAPHADGVMVTGRRVPTPLRRDGVVAFLSGFWCHQSTESAVLDAA